MIDRMRLLYANYILTFLRDEDPNSRLFRTLVDTWFAYKMGPPFVDDQLKARWLNRGDLVDRKLARALPLKSRRAAQVVNSDAPDTLVKDHAIPVATLLKEFRQMVPASIEELEATLARRYSVALLTLEEHDRLNSKAAHFVGPDVTPEMRYRSAGIEMAEAECPNDRRGHMSWSTEDLEHKTR